jgi:hypothetical protein
MAGGSGISAAKRTNVQTRKQTTRIRRNKEEEEINLHRADEVDALATVKPLLAG